MDMLEAMRQRHSVRRYLDRPIEGETLAALEAEIAACNRAGGLHIQLVCDEPKAFDSTLAHYGRFAGVKNYLALIGPKGADLDEKCGYYGERLVLKAQCLGLNTCWVALTYKKIPEAFRVEPGERLVIVISIGYGETQGVPHRGKEAAQVREGAGPDWFERGVAAALLAPTAVNQQKFRFRWQDGKVLAKAGIGPCAKIDLGIVKYHFELGAGKDASIWA